VSINYKILEKINNDIVGKNIKLLIVTKNRSCEDVKQLIKMGYSEFAENRVQEAQKKYIDISPDKDFKLNLIGPLQSNKVKQALNLFDTIQSVDREKIVNEISKHVNTASKTKNFYIQINIGQESQKSGIDPDNFNEFYNYCINKKLNISGIMCIPPQDKDPRPFFEKMNVLRSNINKKLILSMGMSSDYEIALECQTDEIRIGSLIFS
tara:strand:+ start:1814 stop:2440 length:627 start_codon:yes stop_codon:yes gene_type:complete